MSGQVEGNDSVCVRERGRDVAPPMCMGSAAVNEDQAPLSLLSPSEVVDLTAIDGDDLVVEWDGKCVGEPLWNSHDVSLDQQLD